MIVLTAEEAEKVRGRSPKDGGHTLDPAPLKDGRYMLGEEVLDAPAHDDVRDFLAALPREPLEKLPVYTEADTDRAEEIEPARLVTRAVDKTTPLASSSR
jgi:hypothetical protein